MKDGAMYTYDLCHYHLHVSNCCDLAYLADTEFQLITPQFCHHLVGVYQ